MYNAREREIWNKLTERAFVCLFVYFFHSFTRSYVRSHVHFASFIRVVFFALIFFIYVFSSFLCLVLLLCSALGGISRMYIFARLHWLSIELKSAASLHTPPVLLL